jgi:26S proteasome regulatory subunit N2
VHWSGKILLLDDTRDGEAAEEGEYIELDKALWEAAPEPTPTAAPTATPAAPSAAAAQRGMDWDGEMPAAFEWEFED